MEQSWLNLDFVPTFISPGEAVIWETTFSPVVAVVIQSLLCLQFNFYFQEGPFASFTIIGTLVSLVTVFRTSQAYQRYWEARSQLGLLMAGLVDTASCSAALMDSGASQDSEWRGSYKAELARLLRLYMRETTRFLRASSAETKARSFYWKDDEEVRQLVISDLGDAGSSLTEDERQDATPEETRILSAAPPRQRAALVLQRMRDVLQRAAVEERMGKSLIGGQDVGVRLCFVAQQVGPSLAVLQRHFNGCAKIATTPFPTPYIRIGRILRFTFVFSAPFLLCGKLGETTVPITALIAFGFHGIDSIANQLTNPFVGKLGDSVLDGRFTKAVCDDVNALLIPASPSQARAEGGTKASVATEE